MAIFKPRWAKELDREVDTAFASYRDESLDRNVVAALTSSIIGKVEHKQRARFANREVPIAYVSERIAQRWRRKLR